jgi:hypothetical protein
MFAGIDPNAPMGPMGLFIGAALFAMVAVGTLVSSFRPCWRPTAEWRGGVARSAFGTVSFSTGLLIIAAGMVVCAASNQQGPFAGLAAWLFCGGAVILVFGPAYDLIRSLTKR